MAKEVLPERPLLQEPFPRLEYAEAMDRYGSDKPDLRFGMELVDLTDAVRASTSASSPSRFRRRPLRGILAPGCGSYSRRELDELTDLARRHGAVGWSTCRSRPTARSPARRPSSLANQPASPHALGAAAAT